MDFIENFLPFLFWIGFIVLKFVIKKEDNEDVNSQDKKYPQNNSMEHSKSKNIESPQKKLLERTLDNNSDIELQNRKKNNNINNNINNNNKIKIKSDTEDEQEAFINREKMEEDILRGIIFKEIIDKPRAKNPYKRY
ncbi:hypothetical protein [Orenia marismortui]|uniref:Uncharacterized protein n=1 Tax=Orenia marismortui TaxID=46469 RepID=A0A4R8GZE2_9FIRM|nr:hypothetical protein [Orenia marismortui]TDX52121.1 hypothetical protein C7959_10843 [Orenia marismortui]